MITCRYVEYQSKISIIWILKGLILQGRKKPQFWHWFSQPAVHHWYYIKNPPQDISEFANYELFYKTVRRMKIPYFSVSYIFLHPKLLWYPFSNSTSDSFSKQKNINETRCDKVIGNIDFDVLGVPKFVNPKQSQIHIFVLENSIFYEILFIE